MAENRVVDLEARRRRNEAYQEKLRALVQLIDDFRDELRQGAINLAMAGPWREREASVPVGTVVSIGWQDLSDTGDENLNALVEIELALMAASARMEGTSPEDPSSRH